MTDDPKKLPFQAAHDMTPILLTDIECDWQRFMLGFNSSAIENGFRKLFHVHLNQDALELSLPEIDHSVPSHVRYHLSIIIKEAADGSGFDMSCDLMDGNGPIALKFGRDNEAVQQMYNRCQAEVLAAVGPEQGMAYRNTLASETPSLVDQIWPAKH